MAKNLNQNNKRNSLAQFARLSLVATLFSLSCSPILKKGQARGIPSMSDATKAKNSNTQDPNCPLFFEKINYCASLTPTTPLSPGRYAHFELKFWQGTENKDQKQFSDPGLTPQLWLWMPSMNHGSMPILVKTTSTPGVFSVENVAFTMAGDWDLHVDLNKNSGESVDKAVVSYLL